MTKGSELQTRERGLLRRSVAAEYLSLPVESLDQLYSAGRLPRVRVGRSVFYRRGDLDDFAAKNLEWGGHG